MEPTINERFIKLSSRVPFSKDINYGDDIIVIIGGHDYIFNCVKIEGRDNQDGSIDKIFTLKSTVE